MNRYAVFVIFAAVIALWGSILIVQYGSSQYDKGYETAKGDMTHAYEKAVRELRQTRKELGNLSDDDLIRRYCKWVYDISYDDCVRTVKYVP